MIFFRFFLLLNMFFKFLKIVRSLELGSTKSPLFLRMYSSKLRVNHTSAKDYNTNGNTSSRDKDKIKIIFVPFRFGI